MNKRFRFIDDVEMADQRPPRDLVEQMVSMGSFASLYGEPAAGKSFVALDLGLCIAAGISWQGRSVKRGTVAYIVAEGKGAFGKRIRAWKKVHEIFGAVGAYFLPEPVQFVDGDDVERLVTALDGLPEKPVLVIIDTLARCFGGHDENSPKDMGQFIENVDRIRTHTGAAVLVLHHPDKRGRQERGSSTLRGALDTLIEVKKKGDVVTLKCKKQKDSEPFEDIRLRLQIVALKNDTSCVVEMSGVAGEPERLSAKAQKALETLRSFGAKGAGFTEWMHESGLKRATFARVRTELEGAGALTENDGKYTISSDFIGEQSHGLTTVSTQSRDGARSKSQESPPPIRGRRETPGTIPRTVDWKKVAV